MEEDIYADMSISRIIAAVEERYGEIVLNYYDFETDLNSKYRPRGRNRTFSREQRKEMEYYMVEKLREEHLVSSVVNSPYDRIAVVYGGAHIWGVRRRLEEVGWYEVYIPHKYYDYSKRPNPERFVKRVAEIESAYLNGLAKGEARREAEKAAMPPESGEQAATPSDSGEQAPSGN